MSQRGRILAQLERAGHITPVDFAAPDVCDGGLPIMRVAARIQDLRDQGHLITTGRLKNGCAVYTLEDFAQSDHGKTDGPSLPAGTSTMAALTGALGPAGTASSSVAPLTEAPPAADDPPVGSGELLFDTNTYARSHYQDAA